MKRFKLVIMSICSVLLLSSLFSIPAIAQTITEIIDATGNVVGNTLNMPFGIAVDGSGNVYVAGDVTNNAFKITPNGVITQIIDVTGDGMGNTLSQPRGIAVDGTGNVYVAGNNSHNAFKIIPTGNELPEVDAGADQTVDEGVMVNLAPATFNNGSGDTHMATINWEMAHQLRPARWTRLQIPFQVVMFMQITRPTL